MRILLVGALSWNPERVRSLSEAGHELWGLWSRSMAWDQGPYPATEQCIKPVALADAARTIRDEKIDSVYSLFQVYDRRLWGHATPGVEHDVWTLLRTLLLERQRGVFDAPIVRHWGFDVHNLDLDVARALDGHLFCNREKLAYWTAPTREGGCGLDVLGECEVVEFLDGDRPKLEFMNDRFGERLSDRNREIHTVCIGRPFHVNYLELARRGIHLHVYGNSSTDSCRMIAADLSPRVARRNLTLLRRYLHLHASLQTVGASWPDVQRTKARWVEEFSSYDAGWSYIGAPLPWAPLDDRAAIPNRIGTYLLASLPVITDRRPGYYRYDELKRLGVAVELVDSDYDALRADLESELRTREKASSAREERDAYSFDASIGSLLGALERARTSYFARPHAERSRFLPKSRRSLVHFTGSSHHSTVAKALVRWPASGSGRPAVWRQLLLPWRTRRLARALRLGGEGVVEQAPATVLRVAALERFAEPSRRCEPGKTSEAADMLVWNLPGLRNELGLLLRSLPGAMTRWATLPRGGRRRLLRACLQTGGARLGALVRAPDLYRRARGEEIHRLACFASKDFALAKLLAEELEAPLDVALARGTQYFGEFGFELLAVVPYAYWLHDRGRLEFTVSSADTRCLYYFSRNHEERTLPRRYVPITEYPIGEKGKLRYDRKGFPDSLDTSRWLPPPYREVYRDERFLFDREICIVSNKTSNERYLHRGFAVNSMEIELVLAVIGRLRTRYQVIYNRPRANDIVPDHQAIREPGDLEAVEQRYPDVMTIQDLHTSHPDLSFNELQLRLHASCERFVSVLGGASYLASYFGGTNVIYARRGWEISCGAFKNWFDRFSGARIMTAGTPRALLETIECELL